MLQWNTCSKTNIHDQMPQEYVYFTMVEPVDWKKYMVHHFQQNNQHSHKILMVQQAKPCYLSMSSNPCAHTHAKESFQVKGRYPLIP